MEGTWNFFTEDLWKLETLKGIGKLAVICIVEGSALHTLVGKENNTLSYLDFTFGTDLNETKEGIKEGIKEGLQKGTIRTLEDVRRGNWSEVGENVGQTMCFIKKHRSRLCGYYESYIDSKDNKTKKPQVSL